MVDKLRIVPASHPRRERYKEGSDDRELLQLPEPLFALGQVLSTPGALEVIQRRGIDLRFLLLRHVTGDWGDLDDEDKAANETAILARTRILSAYGRQGEPGRLWIITEADRSSTTILLPEEY